MTLDPTLKAQIETLLAQANPSTVPSGLLHWWGRHALPDGSASAAPLTQAEWEAHYGMLELAALQPGLVKPLALIQHSIRNVRHEGPFPLALAYFRYSQPDDPIVDRVIDSSRGDAHPPLPASLAQVISEKTAFMAAALLPTQWNSDQPTVRSRVFDLVLDGALYLAPPGTPVPDGVTVACGEEDAKTVRFGERVTCICDKGDAVVVTVSARWGGETLTSRCKILVGADRPAPAADERWRLSVPGGLSGEGLVYRAVHAAGGRRYLIIGEGFPGSHPPDYLFDQLNQHNLLESFRAQGFDVVLVTFDDGMNLMQLNAEVMIECIKKASRDSAACEAGHVVGGVSMGGLIARYALAAMEHRGIPHHTSVYLSIDSPHRGSRTSVASQWFAHFFNNAVPQMPVLVHLLDSKANQQFLPEWFHDGRVIESPLRTRFFDELKLIGSFPHLCTRLAVACGRGDGGPNGSALERMVEWTGSAFAGATLRTEPKTPQPAAVANGHCFRSTSGVPPKFETGGSGVSWETVPGSYNRYNELIVACASALGYGTIEARRKTACAVPTASALDLDIDDPHAPIPYAPPPDSSFDDYIFAETDQEHTQLTPAISAWILKAVMEAKTRPKRRMTDNVWTTVEQTKFDPYAFDPAKFDPHARSFTTNPYPFYEWFRVKRPVQWVGPPYNSYWVFGYEDVHHILGDDDVWKKNDPDDAPPSTFRVLANLPPGIFSSDNPAHDDMRRILEPTLARAIGNTEGIARDIASGLVREMRNRQRVELINAFASPMPSGVLRQVLGVAEEDWPLITRWVDAFALSNDPTRGLGALVAGASAALAMRTFYHALLNEGPFDPAPGSLLDLLGHTTLWREQAVSNAVTFSIAGYLSAAFLIGTGTLNLLSLGPAKFDELRGTMPADPALMTSAIWEMLRYDSPFQLVDRVASCDTTIGSRAVPRGSTVTAVIGSANHDETKFEDANAFNPRRFVNNDDYKNVLVFGGGIHRCIGEHLAMKVLSAAFRALLTELEPFDLAGHPQWQTDPFLRAVGNLPIEFRSQA